MRELFKVTNFFNWFFFLGFHQRRYYSDECDNINSFPIKGDKWQYNLYTSNPRIKKNKNFITTLKKGSTNGLQLRSSCLNEDVRVLPPKPVVYFLAIDESASKTGTYPFQNFLLNLTTYNSQNNTIQPYRAYYANYPKKETNTLRFGKKVYLDEEENITTLLSEFSADVCQRVRAKHGKYLQSKKWISDFNLREGQIITAHNEDSQQLTIVGYSWGGVTIQCLLKDHNKKSKKLQGGEIERVILGQTLSSIQDTANGHHLFLGALYRFLSPFLSLPDYTVNDISDYIRRNVSVKVTVVDSKNDDCLKAGRLGINLKKVYNKKNQRIPKNLSIIKDSFSGHELAGVGCPLFRGSLRHNHFFTTLTVGDLIPYAHFSQGFYPIISNMYLSEHSYGSRDTDETQNSCTYFSLLVFNGITIFLIIPLLLLMAWIGEFFIVMHRSVEKTKESRCCLAPLLCVFLIIRGWILISLRMLYRMVFYPLYALHAVIKDDDDKWFKFIGRSILGIALIAPTSVFSVITILCMVRIILLKYPHFLDPVAQAKWPIQIRWLQQDIPVISKCYNWVKLPGIPLPVNNMLHRVVVDGLFVMSMVYVFCIMIRNSVLYWKNLSDLKNFAPRDVNRVEVKHENRDTQEWKLSLLRNNKAKLVERKISFIDKKKEESKSSFNRQTLI